MLQELLLACYTDNVKNPEMRDPELERLLCNYNTSLDQVQEVKDSINKTQQSEQNIAKRLWKTDTITQTLETKCGDQSAIKHEYSYQQAQYQTHENTRLTLTLQRLRSETNALLCRRFYEATLIRLEIQTLLDRILWELPCRAIPSTSKSEWEDQGTRKHDGLTLIRLLNTLFSTAPLWSLVLKEPTEEQEVGLFEKCVRAWILEVGGVLLDFSLPSERRCLLLQLLQTRSASWAIPLLQYSFHPTSKLPVADMEEYVVAIRMIFDHRLYESKDGTQTCPLPVWTEDDLLLALDQFGVAQTFCATIQEAFRQPLTKESVDALFKFADDLLDALNVGMRIMSNKGYKDLAKRLGQTTCHMAQRLIENIDESIRKESQHRIDKFISNVVLGYLQVEEKSMYNFLPILPFHGVSIDSLWTITLQLLKIDDLEKPDDFEDQLALPDMTHFLRFLEANQTQGIFMLGCLSNITTCILPTKDSTHSSRSLSGYLVTIIAHTLFIIAFVDTNLCDIYYKDVRDNFDPVCTCHPFVISLLLRWTYDNFSKMEGMTLYLFHSLPLDRWVPQTDDLVLLHKLLCKGPSASTQVSFGRYVIEHLNFGTISGSEDLTISKSQPWHNRTMPFLPYEIHEEIAFLLLDACQKYQPLPENEKSSNVLGIVATAMSAYMVNPDQLWTAATSTIIATEFIQWAWKVALQLKLYDCPITTRAADIEKAITPAFLKDALHHHHDTIGLHHALLTYVSFLLSSTSRHFLRFETSNGWLKLLLILRRGKPEAVIQVMSDIIPAFVYMHGDDFFNDESLGEFLRQMMEFKADPMLTRAALLRIPKRYHQSQFWSKQEITGIGMVLGSHAWQGHFIDSVGDLMDENGGGFSYLDLMLHSWLKTVFSRKEWMWSDQYVMAVDCIAKIAFSLGRYDLVRSMLMSEHMRLEQNRSQQLLSSPKLAALGGQHRNPLRFIKNIMPDTAYTSLLAGEWTMMSLTANNLMRAPGVESRSFWFAYEVLVMETIHDQEQRYGLARAALDLIKQRKTEPLVEPEISGLFKTVNAQIKKPSDFLSIYRWAQHILVLPHNHPLLPLYLQIFFCLYYSSVTVNDKTLLYGTYFFSKKQELLHRVRDRTAYLQTYHSQQPSGEKGELGVSAIVSTNSNISISSCCSSNQSSGNNHEALRQIYYSMWLWLGNPDLLRPDFDLSTLPPHYSISRLKQCRQSSTFDAWEVHQPWNSKTSLWFDLVNKKQLQDAFIQFPWEGSEKFCKRPAGSIETQATVADEGSVYSNNEIFRVISKPIPTTIQPPPATQFKKPITVLPGEQLVNMDPKDLLGPTFETFQHHAVLFQERIKNQEDLDEAYVEQLGLLYTNTPITETLTIPCVQMPQGICKKPAQLTLSATFVETNTEVRQQIEQNRKEANQLIFDSVDTTVCHEALVGLKNISSIAKYYTEIRTKQQTKEDAKCLQLSWSCITYALKCFEDSVEMYPPFRLFLRQMAKSLADLINTQQLSAERLLQLMMAKETRVVILYPAFRPNIDPKNMVSMHQRVSDTNIFGPRSQLYLLSAFDMSNWGATTFATKQDRDSFYTNSFGSLKYWMEFQSNQVDLPTIASIRIQQYKLSLSLMTTILAKQPQAMEHVTVLRYALNLLSETNDTKEADGFSGAMIDSLTESLGGRSRKVLDILNTKPDEIPFRLAMLSTPEEVSSLVDYLGSYISTISNQKGENGDLFGVFGYASPALCRLMVNALCDERIMDQNTNIVIPAPSFWTRTTECFHGWWKSSDDCAMICGESDHSYTKREYLPFFAEAYGHLIKRMLILVPLDNKAKLLGVLFDYYHEEIITHHSELWLDRFNGALVKLPWGSLEMSEGQLDKIKSTWSLLKSDNSTKRIVYLGFAFVILRLWLKKYAQKKEDYINRSWLKSYFQVFFIFLQDSVELWPVEKERLEALQILHNVMIDNQNIDVLAPKDIEETLVIPTDKINGLLGKWPEEKDTSTTALCVRWIREITRFDEKETPMRMKKVFSDFIMKLLSESSKDQLPSKDVQEYWVNQIWANINYHTEDDTREPFDAQLKDLLKSMLDTLDQDQFEAGWNVLVANASQGQPKTVLALFSALLSIKLSPKSTYFMERCLESYLDNSANKKIPQEYWDKLSLVITNSTVNTTLLLKYCMDKSFLLTIRAYCEAMIQQNQNAQTKQAEFAEEIAAIVSITKIQTSDQTQAKKMTYLIQQFAQVFCKNKANTLKEARLVAGLISLSRTTARWANPNLPLSNATPNGINDPKPLPACPAWQHFSLLLDSFLAIRLEEAGMGISTLPSSRVSLEDRIKRLETIRIKKNVAFDEALSDGISIIKDGSQWSLWKLDKVVSKFSEILFI